ncbi:hypothetical protein PG993_006848 [Apiospora rasikravindrae]|uniref:Uncharacterized protein n=1 Tax=Apiospora rasikravindrae TaxID=990691 RepID=A0ABR1SW54_9PEZI
MSAAQNGQVEAHADGQDTVRMTRLDVKGMVKYFDIMHVPGVKLTNGFDWTKFAAAGGFNDVQSAKDFHPEFSEYFSGFETKACIHARDIDTLVEFWFLLAPSTEECRLEDSSPPVEMLPEANVNDTKAWAATDKAKRYCPSSRDRSASRDSTRTGGPPKLASLVHRNLKNSRSCSSGSATNSAALSFHSTLAPASKVFKSASKTRLSAGMVDGNLCICVSAPSMDMYGTPEPDRNWQ